MSHEYTHALYLLSKVDVNGFDAEWTTVRKYWAPVRRLWTWRFSGARLRGYVRLRMEGCLRLDITKETYNSIAIYEGYVLVNMMKRPGARMVGGSVAAGKRAVKW